MKGYLILEGTENRKEKVNFDFGFPSFSLLTFRLSELNIETIPTEFVFFIVSQITLENNRQSRRLDTEGGAVKYLELEFSTGLYI